jgi:peroxin-19
MLYRRAIINNPTDVLDDFSKPKPAPAPAPAPSTANTDASTGVAPADFDEDAFLKQLEADMANMMGGAPPGAGGSGNPADFQATVDQGADVFAKQLEESGIPPGDFLKQLLADVMAEEGGGSGGASAEGLAAAAAAAGLGGSGSGAGAGAGAAQDSKSPASGTGTGTETADAPAESFNDAIKRTMGRMKESGDKATAAASSEDDISDDMLAQLLKAVEAGAAGAGDEGDLSKMFMGMMEQLSNKEMLYEPMKELDGKFGPWLEKSKAEGKVSEEDMVRYETQAKVVKQIVGKFEESGYSDDDPKCREYVWERMQEVSLVFFLGRSFIVIILLLTGFRCKLLAVRLKSLFQILLWRIWVDLVLVLRGRLVCQIVRSSDLDLKLDMDVDVDMNEDWRSGSWLKLKLNLSCYSGSVLYIYTTLVDTLIYMQTELLTVPIHTDVPYPIPYCKEERHAMHKPKINPLKSSGHIHILTSIPTPTAKLRIRQSHKDIIILIIAKWNPPSVPPQTTNASIQRRLRLPQRHLQRFLLRNEFI